MGDEPWLIMPMGIDSYKTRPYEIKSILYDLITRTRAFASSLSRFVSICFSAHAGRTQKNQQDSREDEFHGGDTPLVMNQTAI